MGDRDLGRVETQSGGFRCALSGREPDRGA